MDLLVKAIKNNLKGIFKMPGDKSIAHRSLIIGALPKGSYRIYNFPNNLDCNSTLKCMEKLGVKIKKDKDILNVTSPGYDNLNKDLEVLDAGNSGTTVRLLSGVLSGASIKAKFIGDDSLKRRPMARIINPLTKMGASIESNNNCIPLEFFHHEGLESIEYIMEVSSAQVKSCILLAALKAKGKTKIIEKQFTRDHTERMLKYLGALIDVKENVITIEKSKIKSKDIYVPGDISSAAFLICAALICEDSNIKIENVLLNEKRCGFIQVLKSMGANIKIEIKHILNGEEIGDVYVKSSNLKAMKVDKDIIPNIIDEIPVLSVVASFSEGITIFESVDELKYKECNRIDAILDNLKACGVNGKYENSNLIIEGNKKHINKPIKIKTFSDHRIALAFLVLSLKNKENTIIENFSCTEVSFKNVLDYFPIEYENLVKS